MSERTLTAYRCSCGGLTRSPPSCTRIAGVYGLAVPRLASALRCLLTWEERRTEGIKEGRRATTPPRLDEQFVFRQDLESWSLRINATVYDCREVLIKSRCLRVFRTNHHHHHTYLTFIRRCLYMSTRDLAASFRSWLSPKMALT